MFDKFTNTESFKYTSGLFKIGLRKENDSIGHIFQYLIPEIMIITFIMLNQVALKLIGLYDHIEEDHEGVNNAIQRYIHQGDTEKVQEMNLKRTHMDMDKYFVSFEDQEKHQ